VNPNDSTTPYYLYYSVASFPESWISVRRASTVAGLASAPDTILWKNYQASEPDLAYIPQIYAPNMTYDSGSSQYVLRFESQPALSGADDSNIDTIWDVTTLTSSSPTSGFTKAGGNPYHSGGYACPSNFLAGSTLYSYYCHYTGSAWQITYTTATPSSGLAPYSKPQSSLWTAVNDASDNQPPAWNIVPCTAWNGASGHCLYGFGRYSGYNIVNMLESNYTGSKYIVGARVQLLEYEDAQLAARISGVDDAYTAVLFDGTGLGENNLSSGLYPAVDLIGSGASAGTITYNTWYKLELSVNGTTISTSFNNGTSTASSTDRTYSSGYAGIALDLQTSTLFDNFYVRQYAATPPANSVGPETPN
jgi:hypothetical protein